VCFEAIRLLIQNSLRPLRTIRFIAWSGHELGDGHANGALEYIRLHEKEMENHVLAYESDKVAKNFNGFGFTGGAKGYNLIKMVSNIFFKDPGAHIITRNKGEMPHTVVLNKNYRIPIMKNFVGDHHEENYVNNYHHSPTININELKADDLDRQIAYIASMFYILADVPWRLPRD
jgi:carboxypeptidase Q